jgi:hypothetical protein
MLAFLRTTRSKIVVGAAAFLLVAGTGLAVYNLVEEEAPGIPHTLEGRADCVQCHARPGGSNPVPEDHAGRANSTCRGEHEPEP